MTNALLAQTSSDAEDGLIVQTIDYLRDAANYRGPNGITQRLLEHVRPHKVHVLQAGRITRSGDIELARELESTRYAEAAV